MKAIQDVLGDNVTIAEAEVAILEELKSDAEIMPFIQKFQLTDEEIIQSGLELQAYSDYANDLGKGIHRSGNTQLIGKLTIDNFRNVKFGYHFTEEYEQLEKLRTYITCYYMNDQMLRANFEDFAKEDRTAGLFEVFKSVAEIRKGIMPTQGFFIGGKNGVGKTHMLLALAKEFYKQEIKSTVVFFPELIRDLKQSPYQAQGMIKKLQLTPILMIDDIGSEMQTSFSRDEVLLPILNARMNDNKLTYFSSNFDLEGLLHHFSQTQYGEKEPVKAQRMIERIAALANEITLTGENKRRK